VTEHGNRQSEDVFVGDMVSAARERASLCGEHDKLRGAHAGAIVHVFFDEVRSVLGFGPRRANQADDIFSNGVGNRHHAHQLLEIENLFGVGHCAHFGGARGGGQVDNFYFVVCAQVVEYRIEKKAVELKIAKSLSSYSVYTFLAYIADTIRFQIDPLVISGLIGLAMVTHYRVAGVFAQYYMQMIIFSVGMLQPVFSRLHGAGDRPGIEKVFYFGTKLSSCISIFICLALIGWGKPFIIRWMGLAYQDAYWPLVVLSLAVLLDVCQKPSIDLLYATFNHRFYTYTNWAEGILNLVFSLLLAKPLGIVGVALGTLIGAFLIRVVLQPWWVCRVNGIGYPIYMRFLGRNLLYCTFLMGAATAISAWGLRPSYPLLVASAICATLIYAIGSWLVVFNPVEREYFKAAIRKRNGQKDIDPATAVAVP